MSINDCVNFLNELRAGGGLSEEEYALAVECAVNSSVDGWDIGYYAD